MPVPNTTTFTLQNVIDELGTAANSLQQCFIDSVYDNFDPAYRGDLNNLLCFRNYDKLKGIELRKDTTRNTACGGASNGTYYIDIGKSWFIAENLYTNEARTIKASASWYATATTARNWNGSSFTQTLPCL
ncbi:hypothetical protein LCGC14_1114230 [marine sediment metagenome]|uniref:Uncharacterized protein n=2 Tax=root TaxID=1 RepID=A0A831VPD3_9FLAO|nr:hypothetical protein [Pricia sp.]HEA22740.1 hypothetical protein [Pricia antarctica]